MYYFIPLLFLGECQRQNEVEKKGKVVVAERKTVLSRENRESKRTSIGCIHKIEYNLCLLLLLFIRWILYFSQKKISLSFSFAGGNYTLQCLAYTPKCIDRYIHIYRVDPNILDTIERNEKSNG